jgi:hypothetical protein
MFPSRPSTTEASMRKSPTDFGPTADFARATALSMPSVTKWTVEPGRGQPSGFFTNRIYRVTI